MIIANPRSLIFDTPSIFSHRHVRDKPPTAKDEKPMFEKLATEGREDGGAKKKEEDGGKDH